MKTIPEFKKDYEEWSGFTLSDEDCETQETLQQAYQSMADTLSDEVYQHKSRMSKFVRETNLPEM